MEQLTLSFDDSSVQRNRYVAEMGAVAADLGVANPAVDSLELRDRLQDYRPTLQLTDAGRRTRDFLFRGPYRGPRRIGYDIVVDAALDLLPVWALELLGLPANTPAERRKVRRRAKKLSWLLRAMTAPAHPVNQATRQLA